MASHNLLLLCSFTSLLFLVSTSSLSPASAQKVKLDLYYESLCPDCSDFIANSLSQIFQNGLIDIIDLNLVPFGNAKLEGFNNETITCQHGPDECKLNTVEACAINVSPDVNKHFPFLQCIENLVVEGNHIEWESCYQKTGFDPQPVTNCVNSGKGKQLELQYANETRSLVPPKEYVPWVVVDGEPLRMNAREFMSYVCKAYKGNPVPNYCSNLSFQVSSNATESTIKEACHVEDVVALRP